MIGMLLNITHRQVHKNITQQSHGVHNHSTLLTLVKLIRQHGILL